MKRSESGDINTLKKLENRDYIGSFEFQPGEKKTLTIAKVAREVITGMEGKKEECNCCLLAREGKALHYKRHQ